jgi:hypothetical protein
MIQNAYGCRPVSFDSKLAISIMIAGHVNSTKLSIESLSRIKNSAKRVAHQKENEAKLISGVSSL